MDFHDQIQLGSTLCNQSCDSAQTFLPWAHGISSTDNLSFFLSMPMISDEYSWFSHCYLMVCFVYILNELLIVTFIIWRNICIKIIGSVLATYYFMYLLIIIPLLIF